MNGFELNKILGAVTGTLAVFLAIRIVAGGVFGAGGHHGEEQHLAYSVETGQQQAEEEQETPLPVLLAAADPSAGERVFRRCQSCHALDANRTGPMLHGVVGRQVASVDGFGYSGALQGLGGEWDFERMYAFLENPDAFADGTLMTYRLRDPEQRAAVIVYLNQESGAPLPLPEVVVAPEAAPEGDAAPTDVDAAPTDVDAAPTGAEGETPSE